MILTIGIILKRFHGRNFSSCQEQKIKILISYIHFGSVHQKCIGTKYNKLVS